MSEAPITQEEMQQLFGETLPMEAVALLWSEPGNTTFGQMRAKLREIAANRKVPTLVERLRSEAANWSATCGPLFDEAANEIERLRSVVRVNGLRWGHSHAEIDEILHG